MLKTVGTTPEGKSVLAGSLQFAATTGYPFEDLVEELVERGYVIDWTSNVDEVLKQGSNLDRAVARWTTINTNLYGSEWTAQWLTRLQVYIVVSLAKQSVRSYL